MHYHILSKSLYKVNQAEMSPCENNLIKKSNVTKFLVLINIAIPITITSHAAVSPVIHLQVFLCVWIRLSASLCPTGSLLSP